MLTIEGMQNNWMAKAEDLQGRLARYPGPAFRKAYIANLMASGSRLSASGDLRTGFYCFDKVAAALRDVGPVEPSSPEPSPTLESIQTDRARTSPLEILRHQWRRDRLLAVEVVLRRHGKRLSSLENQIYREKLDNLHSAGDKAVAPSHSRKVDGSLLDLRTQLYKRVLKSQKVSLRRRLSPAETLQKSLLLPATGATAPIALQTIIGPYNDRYNLGDLLTLMAQADAAWVEEFLDLYRDLRDLKGIVSAERA